MIKKLTMVTIAAAALAIPGAAAAGSMRCGNHLIEDGRRAGPGKYEVLKKCGEPTAKSGNTWVYESGGTRRVVRFDDAGRVLSIDEG